MCSTNTVEMQEYPLQKEKQDEIRNKDLPLRNLLIKIKESTWP